MTAQAPPPGDNTPQLDVRGLSKQFASAGGTLTVLVDVDLQMRRGDAAAVTGPSGSGKSTLLYIIGLLDSPTAGELRISGESPLRFDTAAQFGGPQAMAHATHGLVPVLEKESRAMVMMMVMVMMRMPVIPRSWLHDYRSWHHAPHDRRRHRRVNGGSPIHVLCSQQYAVADAALF